jgi:hypothetical protein
MTERPPPILDYAVADDRVARARQLRRRLLYCVGLPLIAFGLGQGLGPGSREISAALAALGGLLTALALPVK